jgi:hypothetical protein
MDSVAYEVLEQVLIENDYHMPRVVTEHVFERCRGESSRLTIRRTRSSRVQSAAHFIANSLRLTFRTYPPTKGDVSEALKSYRVAEVAGAALVDSFREIIAGDGEVFEESEEVFGSFGPIRWAAQLVDEWDDRCGVCRTEKEFIYLEWFTTA